MADTQGFPYRATIETLLSKNFSPTRTVVLAFGFDEEASGVKVMIDFQVHVSITESF